ncbi:MAG TPA: tetratricopeptide repeat protein [Opitutaceae bacterium]|nr:tetratricopeptide repeat protein [Opitutaceae bacterium]
MKIVPSGVLGFVLAASAFAAGPDAGQFDRLLRDQLRADHLEQAPETDLKKIVNESNSFLQDREPEMTAEEYAMYRKLTGMLTANPALALKLLEGMVGQKEPPSPAFEFILGNAYYAAGRNEDAETHYRRGLQRYPTFLRAWNNLGILYYGQERYAEAVPCFNKSLALGDRDATTFGLLGYSLEKTGNLVAAEMAYLQAVAGDPEKVDWQEALVRLAFASAQFGRAEALVRTLVRQHPADGRYWLTYANVLLAQNKKAKAIAMLEIASANPQTTPGELMLLGDLYAEQKLLPEAVATYRRVSARQPLEGERKLLQLAQVLIAAGELDSAAELLRGLPAPDTSDRQVAWRQVRADLCAAQNRWADARAELEALLRLAPLDGRALLGLGTACAALEDPEHALFAFEAAYRIPATTYRASLELANLELKNRHYAKSTAYLEKAYSLEKTDEVADLLVQVRALAGKDL